MRHHLRGVITVLVVLAVAGAPPLARAQGAPVPEGGVPSPEGADLPPPDEDPQTAEAHALFETGRALAAERRWEEALERFRRSLELVDRPSTRFNVGASLFALERHAEAIPLLERYVATGDTALEAETIAEARALLEQARASIGELSIHLLPEDARVRIDGRPLDGGERRSIVLDPGPHVLRVDADGHRPLLEEIHVAPGERLLRGVRLERDEIPVPAEPPAQGPTPSVAAGGGGVDPWVVVLTSALVAVVAGAAVGIGYELGSAGAAAPSGGSTGVVLGLLSMPF